MLSARCKNLDSKHKSPEQSKSNTGHVSKRGQSSKGFVKNK